MKSPTTPHTSTHVRRSHGRTRERGVALLLVLLLVIGLLGFTALSLELTRESSVSLTSEERMLAARQIVDAGLAQALCRMEDGGQNAPVSGEGTTPVWISFGAGECYYETARVESEARATVRCWARIPLVENPLRVDVSPDDAGWDGRDYFVQGIEAVLEGKKYIPRSPVYLGNGGFEKPLGGFRWTRDVDPFNPRTWETVTSGPSSYQTETVPFMVNALDHPVDWIYNGGTPQAPSSGIHPFSLVTGRNPIAQLNTEAWFENSAGAGNPLVNVFPSVSSTSYSDDPDSPDYAFPVHAQLPNVQDFAYSLWSEYSDFTSSKASRYTGGDREGEYGTLDSPRITFVTGHLNVPSSRTLRGCGILVIRDDFDPNLDTNNTPSQSAKLSVTGTLEWTGLVIISGWSPGIDVGPGGSMTVVGSLMAEDSVMSGGEISLIASGLSVVAKDKLELRYSSHLFEEGGILYDLLPYVEFDLLSLRPIFGT